MDQDRQGRTWRMDPGAWLRIARQFKALYPFRPIPAETIDAWALTLRQYRYDDVSAAVQELAETDDWPSLNKLVGRTERIMEARAQASQELARREAWKRATERGIEAGPRPKVRMPEEVWERLGGRMRRVGRDPDAPTMRRQDQLQRLEQQIRQERAQPKHVRGYCCPEHGRRCEPPSELCCERCSEREHPDHSPGVPCVLGTVPQ